MLEFAYRHAGLASGFFGDLSQNLLIRLDLLLEADAPQQPKDLFCRHPAEFNLEDAPVTQGRQHFLEFRRTKDEIVVLLYVFEMLQEQLGLILGEPVAFIDQEHAFAVAFNAPAKAVGIELFENLLQLVLVLFDCVYFTDCQIALSVDDAPAVGAFAAWLARWPFLAVEAHFDDPGHGCFAGPAQTVKEKAVRDPIFVEGSRYDLFRGFIPCQLAYSARAVDLGEIPSASFLDSDVLHRLHPEMIDDVGLMLFDLGHGLGTKSL